MWDVLEQMQEDSAIIQEQLPKLQSMAQDLEE
jgi:hypothetical protein